MGRPKGRKDSKPRPRIPVKTVELVGTTMGEWKILDYIKTDAGTRFLVECSCGTKGYRNYTTIAYGRSLSCGCKHSEIITKKQIKPDNYSAKHRVLSNYRQGAKIRNILFELNLDDIVRITVKNCFYCDKPPDCITKNKHSTFTHHGIDRVDNSIGYVLSNCVTCCKTCNLLKRDVSKQIIIRAAKFLEDKDV